MALINGNDYDHIDFTKNGVTTRHMLKDTLSRQMSGDLVKVQNEEPTSEGTKIWIKPSGDSEVQVPTYEEFEELSDKIDDADAAIESLAVGAQPTVSVTEVDGHKRFSFGIPASNGIASITKTATDGVIDTYTIAMTDGTSTSFSVNNSDITPESMAEAIATALQDYARIDGYYPDLTAGNADQLNSTKFVENKEPYLYRPSGGTSDIGNRKYLDAIVGVSLPWNQMVRDEASENETDFAPIVTVTDAVEDAAGVKVKIEPVQDLHGYSNPWPGGGGKNKFVFSAGRSAYQWDDGCAISAIQAGDDYFIVNGTPMGNGHTFTVPHAVIVLPAGTYTITHSALGKIQFVLKYEDDTNAASSLVSPQTFTLSEETTLKLQFSMLQGKTFNSEKIYPQIEAGTTASAWTPYANICPISGFTGCNVYRSAAIPVTITWDPNSMSRYIGVDGNIGVSPNFHYSNLLPVSVADYTYHFESDDSLARSTRIHGYNASGTWVQQLFYQATTAGSYECDFSVPEGIKFIRISNSSLVTNESVMPEEVTTIPVSWQSSAGTVYGGTLDVTTGVLTVTHGYVTVSGALGISERDGKHFWYTTAYTLGIASIAGLNAGMACDRLKVFINTTETSDDGSITFYANGIIRWKEPSTNVPADYNAYLAQNPFHFVYELATPVTYQLTASQIRTLLGQNNVWADTGDLALTYTGTDEHLTLESGKKYLARISGTDSMLLGSGQEITAAKGTDNVFDLTQMFGTAVADYVYGQGASFFRKWFPNARYPYNAGELLSVEGLSAHEMVGFNQWDEEWERGAISPETGENYPSTSYIRAKNYVHVFPNTKYFFKKGNSPSTVYAMRYDADYNYIGYQAQSWSYGEKTIPENVYFLRFYLIGTTYNHDICINLAHNASRNGEYEPYEKHSYPLDSTVILRGIPKVDANGVYWDGDRYLPDGTVERRYAVVGLSTIPAWYSDAVSSSGYVRFITPNAYLTNKKEGYNLISDKLIASDAVVPSSPNAEMISGFSGSKGVYVSILASKLSGDLSTANGRSTAFVNYLANNEITIVYELATPTTETAQPYHSTQWVSDWGTEEFVSTGLVPVGHETRYPANLRDKLQHLPDAASGNGSYLITQTDGQMVLTPFPAPPSTAGNYVLKATVVNGVATYTWEVAT